MDNGIIDFYVIFALFLHSACYGIFLLLFPYHIAYDSPVERKFSQENAQKYGYPQTRLFL